MFGVGGELFGNDKHERSFSKMSKAV